MIITLVRHGYLHDCTVGWLHAGSLRLATIELPYRPDPRGPGGQRRISCVPDGSYRLIPHRSAKFGDVWALTNPALGVWYQPGDIPRGQAWGRSAILIHSANVVDDVEGCIAVGTRHGMLGGQEAVLNSRLAIGDLRSVLGRGEHKIVIQPLAGTAALDVA